MKLRLKKIASVALLAVMSTTMFLAGCGNRANNTPSASNANTPTEKKDATTTDKKEEKVEPITISVYVNEPGQQPPADNKIYKLIEEELGAKFEFEFLVGDSKQRYGVMIAGGDYPDVIHGGTELINAGAFIPLDDLIRENAPNLYAHYEPYWKKCLDPETGKFFVMPNFGRFYGEFNRTQHFGAAFFLQKEVIKDAGYPSVDKMDTLDEYFDIIENYVKANPTIDGKPTIGFSIISYDWRNFGLLNPPQHLVGKPNEGGVFVDYNTNVAEIFADKDFAKAYYKKLNEVNAKGLIDRETFTQNYDQYLAKLSTGRVLGMFDQRWNFGNAVDSLVEQGLDNRTWVNLPVMLNESYVGQDWYFDRSEINTNSGYGISVNAKNPKRIIEIFDTLLTEEWQKILQWGIEGEDYMVDENGRFYVTPEQDANGKDQAWVLANKANGLLQNAPKIEGVFSDGNATSPGSQPEVYFDTLRPYDKEFLDAYNFKMYTDFLRKPPENPVAYPAWSINLIDGSEAKIVSTKLTDVQMKYLPQAILAKPENFEAVWADYVKEIRKLNVKAYEDRINEQIQWRLENWGN